MIIDRNCIIVFDNESNVHVLVETKMEISHREKRNPLKRVVL